MAIARAGGEATAAAETVPQMFWRVVSERREGVALREKRLGLWRAITWREFGQRARRVGTGLMAHGFARGDHAAILSTNCPEWLYADLGILGAGGIAVGVYPTDAPAQVEYVLAHSGARVVFVEDEEQLDKVLRVRARLPRLQRIVIFDLEGLTGFCDPMALSLAALMEEGERFGRARPGLWDRRLEEPAADDCAILVYTSGTTGPPKGAMLSHRNIVFQAEQGLRILPLVAGEERLSFLPLCHVAERVVGAYYAIRAGAVMCFAESMDTVSENVREVQPGVFGGVPRIWEKAYSAITLAVAEATPLERWAYRTAVRVGTGVAERRLARRPLPAGLAALHWLADRLVLRNVRRMIGVDRCRYLVTGAAPISPALVKWYLALGRPMLEVYGQTENTGLATVMPIDAIKLGTVGRPVPYGELRIARDGEILLRGPHVFLGYYRDPERTAETIVGGWLHTGDIGALDEDGYLRITDRKKDIIITAGGKNVTPSEIENELKFSPFIADAVVVGDGRKYLTCLIMIDHDNVAKFAQDRDVPFTNFSSLTRAAAVRDLIGAEVEKVNRRFAQVETLKRFRLIEQQLDAEDEELTPTMKLKRTLVSVKYRDLIESMYAEG